MTLTGEPRELQEQPRERLEPPDFAVGSAPISLSSTMMGTNALAQSSIFFDPNRPRVGLQEILLPVRVLRLEIASLLVDAVYAQQRSLAEGVVIGRQPFSSR